MLKKNFTRILLLSHVMNDIANNEYRKSKFQKKNIMTENKEMLIGVQEMNETDLEAVAGGMPEYFVIDNEKYTPEQAIELAEMLREDVGTLAAEEFLLNITQNYPAINCRVVDFCRAYGKNTFGAMQEKEF